MSELSKDMTIVSADASIISVHPCAQEQKDEEFENWWRQKPGTPLPENLTLERFGKWMQNMRERRTRDTWKIVDALMHAEIHWGNTYHQFAEDAGFSPQTLYNYVYVGRATKDVRRPHLPFSYHQAVAPLPKEQQELLLSMADAREGQEYGRGNAIDRETFRIMAKNFRDQNISAKFQLETKRTDTGTESPQQEEPWSDNHARKKDVCVREYNDAHEVIIAEESKTNNRGCRFCRPFIKEIVRIENALREMNQNMNIRQLLANVAERLERAVRKECEHEQQ